MSFNEAATSIQGQPYQVSVCIRVCLGICPKHAYLEGLSRALSRMSTWSRLS